MLFKANTLQKVTVENPCNGAGEMVCNFAFRKNEGPAESSLNALASNIVAPGASIGFHQHPHDEEVYVILSGQGVYYDNDSQTGIPVGPGDMTLTLKGQYHGLTNTGSEPLHFLAVITKN